MERSLRGSLAHWPVRVYESDAKWYRQDRCAVFFVNGPGRFEDGPHNQVNSSTAIEAEVVESEAGNG